MPILIIKDKKSFVQLADLLNIQVITLKIRSHPLGQWMPRVYKSAVSRFLRSMVRHRGFVWTYDVIILINAIFIALDEETPYISYAEWVFLALYIIEILLKVYTYEPRAFFGKNQFWNCHKVQQPTDPGYCLHLKGPQANKDC